jgi:hypothetical protein
MKSIKKPIKKPIKKQIKKQIINKENYINLWIYVNLFYKFHTFHKFYILNKQQRIKMFKYISNKLIDYKYKIRKTDYTIWIVIKINKNYKICYELANIFYPKMQYINFNNLPIKRKTVYNKNKNITYNLTYINKEKYWKTIRYDFKSGYLVKCFDKHNNTLKFSYYNVNMDLLLISTNNKILQIKTITIIFNCSNEVKIFEITKNIRTYNINTFVYLFKFTNEENYRLSKMHNNKFIKLFLEFNYINSFLLL